MGDYDLSGERNFGIRKDVLTRWNRLMDAEYSFVKSRAQSGGSGVDLYLLSMIIGLRIGDNPPLRSLEDKFQYRHISEVVDLQSLCHFYKIEAEKHVQILGRFAGEGINYIYEYHFNSEENMLDLEGLLSTWAVEDTLKRCEHCKKFLSSKTKTCECNSQEFSN